MNELIKVRQLTKKYIHADQFAVDHISFQVNRGEIFGLLGPNGAGKTTTISMLNGLLKPTSGEIFFNGQPFIQQSIAQKKLIGVVPQDIALYMPLSAYENLKFYGKIYGLPNALLNQRIELYLTKLGLEKHANKLVSTFSTGMKRRLNLIVGILHHPQLLFLDEPTVGIDVHSRNSISDFLVELNKSGITMVYTSHYLEEIEKMCNYILILDKGKIVIEGKPLDLLNNNDKLQNLESLFIELTGKALRD